MSSCRCKNGAGFAKGRYAAVLLLVVLTVLYVNTSERRNKTSQTTSSLEYARDSDDKIHAFYNVFTAPGKKAQQLTQEVFKDQLRYFKRYHTVNVFTIGQKLKGLYDMCKDADVECKHVEHKVSETEELTLTALHSYCKANPNDTVASIHSKGSWHPSRANTLLRRALTRSALSHECSAMPADATTCSYSVSGLPHLHTPGAMWVGRCSYIKKLRSPAAFRERMEIMADKHNLLDVAPHLSQIPLGRFALEHWIHSHPDNIPYDVYDYPLTHSYRNTPKDDSWPLEINRMPRYLLQQQFEFDLFKYLEEHPIDNFYPLWGIDINSKVVVWDAIYSQVPKPDSWLWKFYTTPDLLAVSKITKRPWIKSAEIIALNQRYNLTLQP